MFACRIGHEYAAEAFVDQHSTRDDNALWAGVRALEEQVSLARFMSRGAQRRGDAEAAHRHEQRARQAEADDERLRELLVGAVVDRLKRPTYLLGSA